MVLGSECRDFCQGTNAPLLTVSQLFENAKQDGTVITLRTNHLMTLFGSTRETTYFAKGMKTSVNNWPNSAVSMIAALDYRGTNYLLLEKSTPFYSSIFLSGEDGTLKSGFLETGGPPTEVITDRWAIEEFKTEEKFWSDRIHTNVAIKP